jgi:hypothetical protein
MNTIAAQRGVALSPRREARHVLSVRMRGLRWLLIVLGAASFALLMIKPAGPALTNVDGLWLAWMMLANIGLLFQGVILAQALLEAPRETDALRPQASLRWWQACAAIGSAAVAVVCVAGVLLALRHGVLLSPRRLLGTAALASLAIGSGLAYVCMLVHKQRLPFIPVALLPLTLWGAFQAGVLPHEPPLALAALWLCTWPAALLALRVAMRRESASRTRGWRAPRVFGRRRFDPTSADLRWLLRNPRPRGTPLSELMGWAALVAMLPMLIWVGKDLRGVLTLLIYAGAIVSALAGLAGVTQAARSSVLLLPGARRRRGLAWHVFGHACRCAALPAIVPLLAMGIGAVFLAPPWPARALAATALLFGLGVLMIALQVALRALVQRSAWRAAIQAAALLLLCGAMVWVAAFWVGAGSAEITPKLVAMALTVAAAMAALGVAIVWASAATWSRVDFAQLARCTSWERPFDAPTRGAQQRTS